MAERKRLILESDHPKEVAKYFLQQAGYLDERGEVADIYRGGLPSAPIIKRATTLQKILAILQASKRNSRVQDARKKHPHTLL